LRILHGTGIGFGLLGGRRSVGQLKCSDAVLREPLAGVGSLVLVRQSTEAAPGDDNHAGPGAFHSGGRQVNEESWLRNIPSTRDAVRAFFGFLSRVGLNHGSGHALGPQSNLLPFGGGGWEQNGAENETAKGIHQEWMEGGLGWASAGRFM